MELAIIISFVVYLILAGIWGYFKSRKNSNKYYLAGRNQNTLQVTSSLLATILGGSATIGTINYAGEIGWSASWFMILAALGLFSLIPFTDKVKQFKSFTLPDIILNFWGKRAYKISSILIPLAWIGIITAQIVASAKILESFLGLDYNLGALMSGILFIAYTIAGGQMSIFKTDQIQFALIIIGLLVIFSRSLQLENITDVRSSFPFNESFHKIDLLILIFTYATTFFIGPDIYSRLFCSNNTITAKRSLRYAAIILVPLGFIIGGIGIAANAAVVSTNFNAVVIDYAQMILPNWGVGLLAIALLSAVLSSADTTLLSSAMILSSYKENRLEKNSSIKKTRIYILFIGITGLLLAMLFQSIIPLLLLSFSIFTGAFFVPFTMELIGLNYTRNNIIPAILTGGIVAGIGKGIQLSQHTEIGNYIILLAFMVNLIILMLPSQNQKTAIE